MWGAQEKSGGGAHQKIFRRRFAPALCPLTCKLLPTPLTWNPQCTQYFNMLLCKKYHMHSMRAETSIDTAPYHTANTGTLISQPTSEMKTKSELWKETANVY